MPPTELIILDNQGATMTENTIGPYREGVSINVTCMSSGGIPVSNMQMKFHIAFSEFFFSFILYAGDSFAASKSIMVERARFVGWLFWNSSRR